MKITVKHILVLLGVSGGHAYRYARHKILLCAAAVRQANRTDKNGLTVRAKTPARDR